MARALALILCLTIGGVGLAVALDPGPDQPRVDDELVVVFSDLYEGKHLLSALIAAFRLNTTLPADGVDGSGLALLRMLGKRTALLRVTEGLSASDKMHAMYGKKDFAAVEPNWAVTAQQRPAPVYAVDKSVAGPPELWGLKQIHADLARQTFVGSREVLVCIIDSGVKTGHPDLLHNVDPLLGFNFVSRPPREGVPVDDNGHGTQVSGVIGATGAGGGGAQGINQQAHMLHCKMLDRAGRGTSAGVLRCINYCSRKGAHIIVAPLGGPGSSGIMEAQIDDFCSSGGLFVAAAGNDGKSLSQQPYIPAGLRSGCLISVAASDESDRLADFSNTGADIAAPGVRIFTTSSEQSLSGTSLYQSVDGTSMAAAHVAGVAALVMGRVGHRLNGTVVKQLLMDSVDRQPTLHSKVVSEGRLNAWVSLRRAVKAVAGAQRVEVPPRLIMRITGADNGDMTGDKVEFQTLEILPTMPPACYHFDRLKGMDNRVSSVQLLLHCTAWRCSQAIQDFTVWLWDAPLDSNSTYQVKRFGPEYAQQACPIDEYCMVPDLPLVEGLDNSLSALSVCFKGHSPLQEAAVLVKVGVRLPGQPRPLS